MWFLIAGLGLLLLKFLGVGMVAEWPWWWVLAPFGLAVVWWVLADATGYTKRKAMQRMDDRKRQRFNRQRDALGIKSKRG